jgi:hypothetical protein
LTKGKASRPPAPRRLSREIRTLAERGPRSGLGTCKIAAGVVFLAQLFVTSAVAVQDGPVDFAELTQSLREFQAKPSPETAAGVRALLPREGRIKFDDSTQSRAAREALDDALPVLEDQVEAADRDGIRLALNLRAVTDAPISESLDAILGRLITTDATVFLQELLRWKTQLTPRTLGQLVGTLGKEYAEQDRAAVCAEIRRRIDALLAVSEAALTEARDQCVKELRQKRPKCG